MQPRIRKEFAERIKADAVAMGVTDAEMLHLILTWHYFPNPNQKHSTTVKSDEIKPNQSTNSVDVENEFDSLLDDL
jgi:flagellar basal body rod protein FlgB